MEEQENGPLSISEKRDDVYCIMSGLQSADFLLGILYLVDVSMWGSLKTTTVAIDMKLLSNEIGRAHV